MKSVRISLKKLQVRKETLDRSALVQHPQCILRQSVRGAEGVWSCHEDFDTRCVYSESCVVQRHKMAAERLSSGSAA